MLPHTGIIPNPLESRDTKPSLTPSPQSHTQAAPTPSGELDPPAKPPSPIPRIQRCPCRPGRPSSTHLPLSAEMYSSHEMVLGDGGVSDCRRTGWGQTELSSGLLSLLILTFPPGTAPQLPLLIPAPVSAPTEGFGHQGHFL